MIMQSPGGGGSLLCLKDGKEASMAGVELGKKRMNKWIQGEQRVRWWSILQVFVRLWLLLSETEHNRGFFVLFFCFFLIGG